MKLWDEVKSGSYKESKENTWTEIDGDSSGAWDLLSRRIPEEEEESMFFRDKMYHIYIN